MEQVDYSLSGVHVDRSLTFWLAPLTTCLPMLLLAAFASHFRRSDRGAWTGVGLHLAALLPATLGLAWTLWSLHGVARGIMKTGAGGLTAVSAGVAEALVSSVLGFWVSAVLAASMFFWIRRLPTAPSPQSSLRGTWLLSTVLASVLLAHATTLVLAMQLHGWHRQIAGRHPLLSVTVAFVVALAVIALLGIRHAPRGQEASRRAHAVMAKTLIVLLVAAGGITQVACQHFIDAATTGASWRKTK